MEGTVLEGAEVFCRNIIIRRGGGVFIVLIK
jgi:hypothetical protein